VVARGQAKYEEIASDLRARIEGGEYPVDSQLPTKTDLMKRYGVALNTIDAAIRELVSAGIVETQHGRGMFVREPPAPEPADLAERVRELTARFDSLDPDDLRATLARIEVNLMDLYGKLGYDYPREDEVPSQGTGTAAHGNLA
jgi:GntR family transcriptional regulator